MNNMNAKGFTLIELLIVIGIIAILATVVILTLNPAELLRQSRDTTRFSDLSTVNSAIALYLSDVAAANIGTSTASGWCYTSLPVTATAPTPTNTCGGRFIGAATITTINQTSTRGIARTNGWLPIDFTSISTGSPLPNLPVDPVSPNTPGTDVSTTTDDFYYAYGSGAANTYEINTRIESVKFASSSFNDGGNSPTLYEVGTNPGLAL
jgi:prepilin-type N-terminal cleavage/methylation domain-containing protein